MKEKRDQISFRMSKSKCKALKIKAAKEETSVQDVMERKADEYIQEKGNKNAK